MKSLAGLQSGEFTWILKSPSRSKRGETEQASVRSSDSSERKEALGSGGRYSNTAVTEPGSLRAVDSNEAADVMLTSAMLTLLLKTPARPPPRPEEPAVQRDLKLGGGSDLKRRSHQLAARFGVGRSSGGEGAVYTPAVQRLCLEESQHSAVQKWCEEEQEGECAGYTG